MRGRKKNISCPVCKKKYSDMDAAWSHIQWKHPRSRLSPKLKDASLPNGILNPTTAATADTNQYMEESSGTGIGKPLETGPIVLQLSYSFSGGSPWRIISYGRWRIFHHHELPENGPSGINVERIQGLPGKTETIYNMIIDRLDYWTGETQVIILSPTREAAQIMYGLVSDSAASVTITTHLSVGGTNIHEDRQGLEEQPHIVVGTIGRIFAMLERKTINPSDIKFLCVDSIQLFLSSGYENDFMKFCEHLPKDIKVIFLSTKMRYRTSHDLSKLFTHEPLHLLVKEDPEPAPPAVLCDQLQEPPDIGSNQNEDTTQSTVRMHTDGIRPDFTWFRCEVDECKSKFRTRDDLRSHVRFFHWRTTSKPIEDVAVVGDDIPYNDKAPGRTEGVMYLCGLCERHPPFKSSWEFGRHLKRMHLGSGSVTVSKVGLATNSASGGPYMDTYLVHQTGGTVEPSASESESTEDHDHKDPGSLDDEPV